MASFAISVKRYVGNINFLCLTDLLGQTTLGLLGLELGFSHNLFG